MTSTPSVSTAAARKASCTSTPSWTGSWRRAAPGTRSRRSAFAARGRWISPAASSFSPSTLPGWDNLPIVELVYRSGSGSPRSSRTTPTPPRWARRGSAGPGRQQRHVLDARDGHRGRDRPGRQGLGRRTARRRMRLHDHPAGGGPRSEFGIHGALELYAGRAARRAAAAKPLASEPVPACTSREARGQALTPIVIAEEAKAGGRAGGPPDPRDGAVPGGRDRQHHAHS